MTITVLDSDAGMAAVLRATPADRPAALEAMLSPMAAALRFAPPGVGLADLHAMGLGFPLDRDLDAMAAGLERLRQADAWTRVEAALAAACATLQDAHPGLVMPDVAVLLVLGDPSDEYFAREVRGLVGNGGLTGTITLTLLPTDENLARLEAAAVHELHHQLRYAPGGVVWDPATVAVREHVVSEGLADAFATHLHGDLGPTPIGAPWRDDEVVLDHAATGLDVTGMQHFAGWVLGDAAARRFGAEPVGVPTGAGYALGLRLAERYLARTGRTAAEALHDDARDVAAVGLRD